ncbi:MAG TPA: BTAD domain-containing putative transcriptional regulator [Gaiellaceae bacterium]|nr:BTAD domain-containing putative transcriptional regulator [Gaiellaceae bacterium]
MSALPTGVVTFLFTDIEGSTRLARHLRERWGEVRADHQRLLREAFARHQGHEVDTQGDSFFVAFASARDAVLAAVDGQRALASHPWPGGGDVRVRIGIHTAPASLADGGGYVGLGVHRGARICAAAHGGQVLLSQATHNLLEDEQRQLPEIQLEDTGAQRLKDFERPVRLYQVVAPGLAETFAPPRGERRNAVQFRILGPLQALVDDREVALGGPRQRAVLAVLLTHANEVVAIDRLVAELWGERPPASAVRNVQTYVSNLRKVLGPGTIVTRPPGYVVEVGSGELDLHQFEQLAGQARAALEAGEAARASRMFTEALALWHGTPLADFAYEEFAQPLIARLEELRLACLERRIEADLALGRHGELVGELETLVTRYPLRERLREQLMLALYRSGRQAEALEAYQDARRRLVDELGIEPGTALQELERMILRRDAALLPGATGTPGPPPAVAELPERSLLLVPSEDARLDALLPLAEALARRPPRELILTQLVADANSLAAVTSRLQERREEVAARGFAVRAAAFTSATPGHDALAIAAQEDVDLLLLDAPAALLERGEPGDELELLFSEAPCDVAVLVPRGDRPPAVSAGAPVLVPFGGADHEWTAVEIGAWIASVHESRLQLAGTEGDPDAGRRDASKLLARAALIVQRIAQVPTEPVLVPPGERGMIDAAAAAGLVVLGLSSRWRDEGIDGARLAVLRDSRPPALLVRRGLRPGGLAPRGSFTRFTWTLEREPEGVQAGL